MAWTAFTGAQMHATSLQLFEPCVLLINYTLMQYLIVFYWSRRREVRVMLLFTVGLLGVVCLIPFANPDERTTSALNDVSEACCVLAFLIQITIIGRDLNKKIKFKTVLFLTRGSELLILVDLVVIGFSLLCVVWPDWLSEQHASLRDDLPNVCENATLAYIFVFRFYYIIQSIGWREVVTKRKTEVVWYLLFAAHEVPFIILQAISGVSWEFAQSLWNRVTLAACLWVTASAKIRSRQSEGSRVRSGGHLSLHKAVSRSSMGRVQRVSVVSRRGSSNVYAVASSRTMSMEKSSAKRGDASSIKEIVEP